jgi:hypothetical protein
MESENCSLDYAQDIKKLLDIENDFYSNDSLHDDLESRF